MNQLIKASACGAAVVVAVGLWSGTAQAVPADNSGTGQDLSLKPMAAQGDEDRGYHIVGAGTDADAKWTNKEAHSGKFSVLLEKNAPLVEYVYAAAIVEGVEGWTVAELGEQIGFSAKGACGGGAPRFNLYYDEDGDGETDAVAFYGCDSGTTGADTDGWYTMTTSPLTPDGGYRFDSAPTTVDPADVVTSLSVIVDEPGAYYIDDVTVAGQTLGEPND